MRNMDLSGIQEQKIKILKPAKSTNDFILKGIMKISKWHNVGSIFYIYGFTPVWHN